MEVTLVKRKNWVSPERVWNLHGVQKNIKDLSLRHLPPIHISEIFIGLLSYSKSFPWSI
jgi:hypothetical protein